MVDQCIVCLENLDAAVTPAISSPKGLEIPTPEAGLEAGVDRLEVAESSVTGTTNTTTTDEPTPGNADNHDHIAVINVCGHTLHNSCLLEWAGKANSCPICRQSFHLVTVYDKVGGNLLTSYKVEDKKQVAEFDPQAWMDENPEEEEEEPIPCPICQLSGDEAVLLLCDGCDACYHTYCIGLDEVPDDAWFCMECAPLFGEVHIQEPPRPHRRAPPVSRQGRRRNDFFPRTRATMRRARRQARSDEWQGAWGEITGRIFDALDIDLDSHDGDDALEEYRRSRQTRERDQREYERWQQRINIARRAGAQDVFARNIPPAILQHSAPVAQEQAVATPESREERRAWGALEKARECNGEGPSSRKRKSRSVTASPAEPPPEQERKLKRPRTRRIGGAGEASSSKSPPRTQMRAEAAQHSGPSNARSPRPVEQVPSFLSSLLKEVEHSNPSDDEAVRGFFGESRTVADPSSPGSSPSASAYNSPRALSLTPPPQQTRTAAARPTSPTMSLSSHIEPIYPPANYLTVRSAGDASDSESRSSNQGAAEVRQPRPRRSRVVKLPRSPEVSPTRTPLPLEMKEDISSIVRTALKPHWKSSKLTADQYANINRDVSRKLYDEVSDPGSVDDDARRVWEKKATQEVARAIAGLQA